MWLEGKQTRVGLFNLKSGLDLVGESSRRGNLFEGSIFLAAEGMGEAEDGKQQLA